MISTLIQVTPIIGLLGMIAAVIAFFGVSKHSPGNKKMQDIADKIHTGAMVFLKREYTIISVFMVVIFIALATMLSLWTGVAYLAGAICSGFAGWFGMEAATRTGPRACQGAKDGGTPGALAIAFQGGSVMGLTVAALGVIGLGVFFYFLKETPPKLRLLLTDLRWAHQASHFSLVSAAGFTRKAPTWAPTSSARSRREFPKTTRETPV